VWCDPVVGRCGAVNKFTTSKPDPSQTNRKEGERWCPLCSLSTSLRYVFAASITSAVGSSSVRLYRLLGKSSEVWGIPPPSSREPHRQKSHQLLQATLIISAATMRGTRCGVRGDRSMRNRCRSPVLSSAAIADTYGASVTEHLFLNPLLGPPSWSERHQHSQRSHRERVESGHAPVIRVMVGFRV
jgi:hypothetical protein